MRARDEVSSEARLFIGSSIPCGMTVKKVSPNRRKSIAVTNGNHSIVPKARRRAHSVVPGVLSPLAKARRSLVRT